jgi:hypothetical protein
MSRKYRHQGYQDSDRDDSRRRGKAPPRQSLTEEEKIQRRSMRHAIDREAKSVVRCHNCGQNVHDFGSITKTTACPHCNALLHCCRTCVHFDSAARWQCKADITEQVGDKNKANDCAKYEASLVLDVTGRRTSGPRSNDARSQFDSLFKD